MRKMGLVLSACFPLLLFLSILPGRRGDSNADPIRAISPRTEFFLGTAIRSFGDIVSKERGDRRLRVGVVPFIFSYAIKTDATLAVQIPYLEKRLRLKDSKGRRVTMESRGLGDMVTMGKYRFYRKDVPGGSTQAAILAGLKFPTGSDDRMDIVPSGKREKLPPMLQPGSGSMDYLVGFALGKLSPSFDVEGGALYRINTEANDFRFGNQLQYELALQYKLYPPFPSKRNSQLNLMLEINGLHMGKDKSRKGKVGNTGGDMLFLSPGLQYILNRNSLLEFSFQFPVIQELNEALLEGPNPLKDKVKFLLGFRFIF